MGSGSSPGLAGRYGNAVIPKLRTECPAFREENGATLNTWWQQFGNNEQMDEKLGFGRFGLRRVGLSFALVWKLWNEGKRMGKENLGEAHSSTLLTTLSLTKLPLLGHLQVRPFLL
jgi:hypothetical protein